MQTIEKLQVEPEISNLIKTNSEMIWFFAGKPCKEKLYIIPNYKATNSKELVSVLTDFVNSLPLFLLQRLSINEVVVITNIPFDTFYVNDFVVSKYQESNISLNVETENDFYFLSIDKNDLIAC